MKTNPQLRQAARAQLTGNWSTFVIVTFVYLIISLACQAIPYANLLIAIAIIGPLALAYTMLLLDFVRKGQIPAVEGLFKTFNGQWFLKAVCLWLLTGLYTFLWSLLLIIPGIIKGISYSMAPFILADNPDMSAEQAICRSMEMMNGHKMDYFLISLGYIGLTILSMLLLCIPMLWLIPYYQVVFTNFYLELKGAETAAE